MHLLSCMRPDGACGRNCHPHATRILARAWVRVRWRWQNGTPYDPALHGGRHNGCHDPPRTYRPSAESGNTTRYR
ncbi:hypothetical protein GTY63_03095 [Amycolatopsis rubida]|nr:hypothetical protein [Amycolatopsis rubida]